MLVCPAKGWEFAEGQSLADLAPAPAVRTGLGRRPAGGLRRAPGARSRAVRQWAAWMLRRHHEAWLASRPVDVLLRLADHADPDLAAVGFDLLERAPDLAAVPVDAWLPRLDGDDLDKLQRLSGLLARRLDPERVSAADALRLAAYRSKPVAELGLHLLNERRSPRPTPRACSRWCRPSARRCGRPSSAGSARGSSPSARSGGKWVLEFLDSKHADVRRGRLGVAQRVAARATTRPCGTSWSSRRTTTSAARWWRSWTARAAGADPDAVRLLWATVLRTSPAAAGTSRAWWRGSSTAWRAARRGRPAVAAVGGGGAVGPRAGVPGRAGRGRRVGRRRPSTCCRRSGSASRSWRCN